jgi:hypothetical protein
MLPSHCEFHYLSYSLNLSLGCILLYTLFGVACYCVLLRKQQTVQAEYEEEGIPWSHVQFADNAEVLRLLESSTGNTTLTADTSTSLMFDSFLYSYTSAAVVAHCETSVRCSSTGNASREEYFSVLCTLCLLAFQHIMYSGVHMCGSLHTAVLLAQSLLYCLPALHNCIALLICLHMLSVTTSGVIAILNEECVVPKGSDEKLASKLASIHEDHPNFRKNKLGG